MGTPISRAGIERLIDSRIALKFWHNRVFAVKFSLMYLICIIHNLAIDSTLSIVLYVERPICELKRHAGQRRKEE